MASLDGRVQFLLTTDLSDRDFAAVEQRRRDHQPVTWDEILEVVDTIVCYSPRDWSDGPEEREISLLATGDLPADHAEASTEAGRRMLVGETLSSRERLQAIAEVAGRMLGTRLDDVDIQQIHVLAQPATEPS